MSTGKLSMAAAVAAVMLACGCDVSGKVEQGRVVAYDAGAKQVTLIPEDGTAPVTVRTPEDPDEMGPVPAQGKLVRVDAKGGRVLVYDAAAQTLRAIPLTPVGQRPASKPGPPKIDRARNTLTLYSPSERAMVTFTAAPELLSMPADTWKAGDVVRYYYKEPGQALRLMNVTKTDLSKADK
jgi:hypothetical protein